MSRFARCIAALLAVAPASTPAAAEEGTNWTDRVSLQGDLRLRYESIDEDFEVDRDRSRYRVRLGLAADVYDDVQLIFSLATGADNPVSRNVTFGDGFSSDDIGFELAYVDWTINDSLTFFGGKMKNPLFRAGKVPLIYDGDLTPEGFALQVESGMFFGNVAGFLVDERSSSDDSHLYAAQAGVEIDLADAGDLTAGAGYFGYTNTIGNEPFFDGRPKGNTVDLAGNYVFDYRNAEVFAQYDARIGDLPVQFFAQLTRNSEASNEDTAYAIGARFGAAKGQGTWQAEWAYLDIEADAVIGTFSDSDFGGGGTDSSGHILKGKYQIRDRISLGGALFINEVDRFQGVEHDYTRFQLDVVFEFE